MCIVGGHHIIAQMKSPIERPTNARLIAAAPDMLDSLLDLVALLPDPELDNDSLQREFVIKARAAIVKATGGAA